ncbi:MAG: STAS domain-containing protein [Geobacter sp.]|jgi:anti-anti-sigma factor|nr:STAS domain-containing protein [Geobacter sp.]
MAALEIVEQHHDAVVAGLLQGKLDAESVPVFDQWLNAHLDAGVQRVVLDLSGLSYISSAGLRSIMSASKAYSRQSGLALCGLFGMVGQVFQVSGFAEILELHHTMDEALKAGARS